jgi:hypothetical protein
MRSWLRHRQSRSSAVLDGAQNVWSKRAGVLEGDVIAVAKHERTADDRVAVSGTAEERREID